MTNCIAPEYFHIPDMMTQDDIRVGQIWKQIEDKEVTIMIKIVLPKEIRGYMFTGFEVGDYISLDIPSFLRYHFLFHDPRGKKK